MTERGKFIVFEGIDGSGKSTQIHRLGDDLRAQGKSIHLTAEPSRGDLGLEIRRRLRGEVPCDHTALALLFAADRMEHWHHDIAPALDQGQWVLCDRYVMSSLAYQSLQVPLEWVKTINGYAPTPDLTLFFRISYAHAYARCLHRGGHLEILERRDQQQQIAAHYEELVSTYEGSLVAIDADQSENDVYAHILEALKQSV